jgi:hypothetical protein
MLTGYQCLWQGKYFNFRFFVITVVLTDHIFMTVIQGFWSLYVDTSRSYLWHHSYSEMLYEHGSNSWKLWSNGYLKFRIIWTLKETSGSFMHLSALKIEWNSSSLLFTLHSCTMFFMWTHTCKSSRVRSSDHGGQFCGPPRPIHQSGNCSFKYSTTCLLKCGGAPLCWKYNCNVLYVCPDHLEFLSIAL